MSDQDLEAKIDMLMAQNKKFLEEQSKMFVLMNLVMNMQRQTILMLLDSDPSAIKNIQRSKDAILAYPDNLRGLPLNQSIVSVYDSIIKEAQAHQSDKDKN